jgi:4-aminobutyrate aminotransferase-like enzyme
LPLETAAAATTDATLQRFARSMVPVSLEAPIIASGSGSWVTDLDGRRYLDLVAGPGVLALGHSHPRIVEAVKEGAQNLMQSPGKFLTLPAVEYAEALAAHAPGQLRRTFFCNSGAEANEGALKIAKKFAALQGRGSGIVSFQHSFHGRLTHALAVTGQIKYKRGLDTYLTVPGVQHIPYPYPLRTPSGLDCTDYVLSALEDAIRLRAQGGIAAVIIEPLAAVGGIIVPPPEFLPALRRYCDEQQLLLIADEVFTGFGRTGDLFCCEHDGIEPDIMTTAKAIGGGLPLGAFITTDEVAAAFAEHREHFTTFGANSVLSCFVGLTAFRELVEQNLAERSGEMGARLLGRLSQAAETVPVVAEVRGRGLLIGIELADPDERLTPRPELAKQVQARALERGVLISVCGSYDSVIRLSPPLTISEDELEMGADVLTDLLAELAP